MAKGEQELHCSFCGKPRSAVEKLIRSPNGVYICDECVEACGQIIAESEAEEGYLEDVMEESPFLSDLPTPHQIYDELSQYVMGQESAKRA
ncbi:MAG: ATP-dependent Clp protease ATP-binding subunit ClpX, partial [Atopobiaceae bacterium]|nr:ATP-dependent Clp protease ATP-binding subunit ClpX [Atopobiaceae bacterium]